MTSWISVTIICGNSSCSSWIVWTTHTEWAFENINTCKHIWPVKWITPHSVAIRMLHCVALSLPLLSQVPVAKESCAYLLSLSHELIKLHTAVGVILFGNISIPTLKTKVNGSASLCFPFIGSVVLNIYVFIFISQRKKCLKVLIGFLVRPWTCWSSSPQRCLHSCLFTVDLTRLHYFLFAMN